MLGSDDDDEKNDDGDDVYEIWNNKYIDKRVQ